MEGLRDKPKCSVCCDHSHKVRLVPVFTRSAWVLHCEACLRLAAEKHKTVALCCACKDVWLVPEFEGRRFIPRCRECDLAKMAKDAEEDVKRKRDEELAELDKASTDLRFGRPSVTKIRPRLKDRPVVEERYVAMKAYREGDVLVWLYQISTPGAPPGGMRHDEHVGRWSEQDIYELTLRIFDVTGFELAEAGYELIEGPPPR